MKKSERDKKLRRTYKAVVSLEGKTLEKILFLSRALIHLWNLAREEAERWLETKEKAITAYSFNYWLTEVRKATVTLENGTIVSLADISSDMEREVLRKLAGSYQSFFELKKQKDFRARKPGKKKEEWFQAMSWSSLKIRDGKLIVSGYQGEPIEISLKGRDKRTREFSNNYLGQQIAGKQVVFATLSKNRDTSDFELSLVITESLPNPTEMSGIFRAIDLGAGDIAVMDWDESKRIGLRYLIPTRRPDKMWMERIAAVESRQKKRVKGSRGWKRLAAARKYMHNRSSSQKDSHQKKVANELVPTDGSVACIIVGKPKTRLGLARTATGTPAQHYGAQNTGYLFRQFLYLQHKAEERGIRFIELPDPQREGEIDDPESKFRATLKLLQDGYRKLGRPGPSGPSAHPLFRPAEFKIDFGG